jgi:hypothetical protein
MKSKETSQTKPFDTVKTFRKIKEEISLEMAGMSVEQIVAYLKQGSKEFRAAIAGQK